MYGFGKQGFQRKFITVYGSCIYAYCEENELCS